MGARGREIRFLRYHAYRIRRRMKCDASWSRRNVPDSGFRYALVTMTGTGLPTKVGVSQKDLSNFPNIPVSGELLKTHDITDLLTVIRIWGPAGDPVINTSEQANPVQEWSLLGHFYAKMAVGVLAINAERRECDGRDGRLDAGGLLMAKSRAGGGGRKPTPTALEVLRD